MSALARDVVKHSRDDVVYYCTDFGRVRFPPGITVATVRANEATIKNFARSSWERGEDSPFEWPDG